MQQQREFVAHKAGRRAVRSNRDAAGVFLALRSAFGKESHWPDFSRSKRQAKQVVSGTSESLSGADVLGQ